MLAALPAWWLGPALDAADYRWLFALPLAGALCSFGLLLRTREPVLPAAPTAPHPAAEHRLRAMKTACWRAWCWPTRSTAWASA